MADNRNNHPPTTGRAVRWMALATALMTFVLIFAGGMVTSTASGDAEPDWPLSKAFRTEWSWLLEMGHRAIGAVVGLLSLATAVVLHRSEPRAWVRRLGWASFGLVVAQGLLGGLRIAVPEDRLPEYRAVVAVLHTCFGQAIVCLMTAIASFCGPAWARGSAPVDDPRAAAIRRLLWAVPAALYVQIVLGALVRHFHAGWAVFLHVTAAVTVVGLASVAALVVVGRYGGRVPELSAAARNVGLLLGGQLALGIWSLVWFDPAGRRVDARAIVPSLHLLVGVVSFAAATVMVLRHHRFVRSSADAGGEGAASTEGGAERGGAGSGRHAGRGVARREAGSGSAPAVPALRTV